MAKKCDDKVKTPIATLIDVVFLLIIFFVITAAMDAEVLDQTVKLAQAKYSKPPEKVDPRMFIINIRANGTISVGLGQRTTLAELSRHIKELRKKYGNEFPILIRADGNTQYNKVRLVMDEVLKAGLYKVKLSATKKQ
jgi:biopolymer transport protein ExbD